MDAAEPDAWVRGAYAEAVAGYSVEKLRQHLRDVEGQAAASTEDRPRRNNEECAAVLREELSFRA